MVLTRAASHLYRIKPHERRWIYAGVTSAHKQVLMGLYCPYLVAIFFDRGGGLLGVQQRELPFLAEQIERGTGTDLDDARIEPGLGAWQEELGYRPRTIEVHKFFVLDGAKGEPASGWVRDGIGIEDYPFWFEDALAHPGAYTEEDRLFAKGEMARWEKEGLFVLWWGNDYWFDETGERVAS